MSEYDFGPNVKFASASEAHDVIEGRSKFSAPVISPSAHPRRIFLTGATGYIGGRLAPRLLAAGHTVVCLVRSPRKLARPWVDHERIEVVRGDVADEDATAAAMADCEVAYYFIHSMVAAGDDYAEHDRNMARAFARAAKKASVGRIIYLGGLGEENEELSEHLRSRREVERVLRSTGVPVTVFRAAMIIGSGSVSFEILRYLAERLVVMITPRWVRTECQPIAIRDVLRYLSDCLDDEATADRVIDVGGEDIVTYRDLIDIYTDVRELPRRWIIPVPLLTPKISSFWIHLVTPIGHAIARPLTEGLANRVVARDDDARRLMPGPLFSAREAVEAALGRLREHEVETSWSDAGVVPGDPEWAGGKVFEDRREIEINATPARTYQAICRVGGGHGWYGADSLWKLRGALDRMVGGPGLRRGRRDPEKVRYGDALDFWRVIDAQPQERLALIAEMKLPGVALLSFEIEELGERRCRMTQTALFQPKGLFGLLYWYAVLPFHHIVFKGMSGGIKRAAEATKRERAASLPTGESQGED